MTITTTSTTPSDKITERIEILKDQQNIVDAILQFVSNTKNEIYAYIDYSIPFLAIEIDELKKAFSMQREEESDRYVTEITKDNVSYCKELLKMVDEFRHIGDIRGNFYVNKTQYIAPAT